MKIVLFLCTGNYYRSRFAEIVFNHVAADRGLRWRADSAGLRPDMFRYHDGPLAPMVVQAARSLKIEIAVPYRAPRAATRELLRAASRVVALDRTEHEPLLRGQFEDLESTVTYWAIQDVVFTPPAVALPAIADAVDQLVAELEQLDD